MRKNPVVEQSDSILAYHKALERACSSCLVSCVYLGLELDEVDDVVRTQLEHFTNYLSTPTLTGSHKCSTVCFL